MLIEMLAQARSLRRKIENRTAGARSVQELDAWGKKYLQNYLTLPASGLHRWLVDTLQTLHTRRGTYLAIVAPRGSAKSTWASLLYLLWCALNGYERYIVLISDTQSQARLLLEAIKTELEDNVNLARDYT